MLPVVATLGGAAGGKVGAEQPHECVATDSGRASETGSGNRGRELYRFHTPNAIVKRTANRVAGVNANSGLNDTNLGSEYGDEDMQFMNAVLEFQKQSGKKFLAHTDYLRIALELGYRRGMGSEVRA